MQRCPPEIWSEILGHLNYDHPLDHETLKVVALVCKGLTSIAWTRLFCSISIRTVKQAQQLLEVYEQHQHLAQHAHEYTIAGYDAELWTWLLCPRGLALLAQLSHTPTLTLRLPDREAYNMDAIRDVLVRFPMVRDLNIDTFDYRTFEDVCDIFRCFGPTLEHLQLEAIGGYNNDWEVEADVLPNMLSEEVISRHTSTIAFPNLTGLTSAGFACAELTEWLVRAGITSQIQTLTVVPLITTDIQHAAVILHHGGPELRQLIFEMIEEGWEGQSDEELSQLMLPASLETVRFTRVGVGYWELINPILATLPKNNNLKKIELELDGIHYYDFSEIIDWLTTLDVQLQDDCYSNIEHVHLVLRDPHDGKPFEDYAQAMSNMGRRGVLKVTARNQ